MKNYIFKNHIQLKHAILFLFIIFLIACSDTNTNDTITTNDNNVSIEIISTVSEEENITVTQDTNNTETNTSTPNTEELPTLASIHDSLLDYLKKMQFGTKGDNLWTKPNSNNQKKVKDIVNDILNQHYIRAHNKAKELDGELIEFNDEDKIYYVLHLGLNRLNTNNYTASGGTYVFYPAGKNSAIQVPHPSFDSYTNIEGVEAYLALGSKYLLLSGTHRKSSDKASPCQSSYSSYYKESDASHNSEHYFLNVHQVLSIQNTNTLFIELHGFGSKTRKKLWSQCNIDQNQNLVNLSEGTGDLNNSMFIQILHQELTDNSNIKSCIYSPQNNHSIQDIYTSSLGGTQNTSGRFTNGTSNICTSASSTSSHRFIHIEQSYQIRRDLRTNMIQALKNAQKAYLEGQ